MKLHFLGANRQVTGSRYCLEVGDRKVMIDCGMYQERPYLSRNWEICPVPPNEIDALLLTHVHIDHSGLIPRLVHDGFDGPIYATHPSVALAEIMLRDSARIQEEDAKYKKRRHEKEGRRGKYPEEPLYTERDVEQTLPMCRGVTYNKPFDVTDSITVTYHDAGHILGSAMLEVVVNEPNREPRRIIFSGDIGQWNKPIIRDPTLFQDADYVIMESTYGDREHVEAGEIGQQLEDIIRETTSNGGNVVIPTFAVERAQELMYHISQLVHENRIPDIPIFLDSPMAIDVTEVFQKYQDYFDMKTWLQAISDTPPLRFPGLKLCRSVADSQAINKVNTPCILMATAGMCNAGRIKHHLRLNIGRPESCILFVGYQGEGTLGRQIIEGREEVRIHGRQWRVRASVAQIYGFSGHADRSDLLRWISHLKAPPRHIFLTHGNEVSANSLAGRIGGEMQWNVSVPAYQDVVELD